MFDQALRDYAAGMTIHEDTDDALQSLETLRSDGFTPRVAMLDLSQGLLVISTITVQALHLPHITCGPEASEDIRHLAATLLLACSAPRMTEDCLGHMLRQCRDISFGSLDLAPKLHRVTLVKRSCI